VRRAASAGNDGQSVSGAEESGDDGGSPGLEALYAEPISVRTEQRKGYGRRCLLSSLVVLLLLRIVGEAMESGFLNGRQTEAARQHTRRMVSLLLLAGLVFGVPFAIGSAVDPHRGVVQRG